MPLSVETPSESVAAPVTPAVPSLRVPTAKPLWTWVFLTVNIAIWLAMSIVGSSEDPNTLIGFGAKVNALIAGGEYWRFITPVFIHSGLLHLAFNSYALYAIGPDVERLFGNASFVVLYLVSGFGGVVASFAFNSHLSVGASGAIFGLIGALGYFFARHREAFGQAGRRQLLNIVIIVAYNLIFGFIYPGIDYHGHIGGLLTGIALGWALCPNYALVRDWEANSLQIKDARQRSKKLLRILPVVAVLVLGAALAVRVQATSFDTRMERGELLLDAGDLTGALTEFSEAARLQPDSPEADFMVGYVLADQQDYASAAVAFENVVALQSDWPEARWNLALTYMHLGRNSDAADQLQVYISLPISEAERQQANQLLTQLVPSAR